MSAHPVLPGIPWPAAQHHPNESNVVVQTAAAGAVWSALGPL